MNTALTLRVTSIRSQNPRGIGGCIFAGLAIDAQGNVLDARAWYVVRASGMLLRETRVQVGQWWHVEGPCRQRMNLVNGFEVAERQIEPTELEFLLPSGEHIVTLMAESDDFRGVGYGKARKLWETFGNRLYALLDAGDVDTLAKVLTQETAGHAVAAWAQQGHTKTLQWLQRHGFGTTIGRKIMKFFGADAAARIEEDPYRLISFCATWKVVDSLARSRFAIRLDDHRRLRGAVEEALYGLFDSGHTCVTRAMLADRLVGVLGPQTPQLRWRALVEAALDQGLWNGSYVLGHDDAIHPIGPLVMETAVAQAIAQRLLDPVNQSLVGEKELGRLLQRFEITEGLTLNDEQRQAVNIAANNAFALVTGGAGVGKTTVLKAAYAAYDRAGIRVYQMALAGRAAKRMQEATGRPASTIASFLGNAGREPLDGPLVVVVDEASMLDIVTMHRLCRALPAHARLLLVGDPAQLMPVGPGLVLHALVGLPQISSAELKVVKRYGNTIAQAAESVRNGVWPVLPADPSAPISMLPCIGHTYSGPDSLAAAVLDRYRADPENTQILCARRSGPDGTRLLNAACQVTMTRQSRPMVVWSAEQESWVRTGFHEGDLVLCTRNLWARGVQNGSLGRLVQIENPPRALTNEAGEETGLAIGWILWDDGERRPVLEDMLDDLEPGFAITVHKAQGSQWPRVIVPVTRNRLLDRTLLYTAITRAQRQVVLVGDVDAARAAVEAMPKAHFRQIGLTGQLLTQLQVEPSRLVKSVNSGPETAELLTPPE
ncbi:ATP-dependent DNA helicase [Paraburkholderia domus]|uniref:ATP-dependent DNA helicase n=1 Tax=Paraburkholderia domus TaxID=2793075 RepID=UPI00191437DF|nr:AAA family ATPase [Paraburkholderia domus]MBK5179597.1 AAA family ATPase [Burkholderia sp. R-69749]CAE6775121.1 ATP-dependent RecD-like DNA helicase [Paraburkholderia domus]